MRTDLKIGIGIGLVIAVLAVVYFVFLSPGPEQQTPEQARQEPAPLNEPVVATRTPTTTTPSTTTPSTTTPSTTTPSTTPSTTTPSTTTPSSTGPVRITFAGEPNEDTTPTTPVEPPPTTVTPTIAPTTPSETVTVRIPEPEPTTSPWATPTTSTVATGLIDTTVAIRPVEVGREPAVPAGTPTITLAASGNTYEVQEGDTMSSIAEKFYGNPNKWNLIAAANPDVDPARMRTRTVLKIPPAPTAEPATTTTTTTTAGTGTPVAPAAAGEPTPGSSYAVKDGDTMSSIAQRAYGNPNKWNLIAAANPDVDPARMRRGQVLKIPTVEAPATTPGTGTGTGAATGGSTPAARVAVPPTEVSAGVYYVQEGDSTGFYGIARKVYGESSAWQAIVKANPDVDSSALKVGQKVVMPSLRDVRRALGRPEPTGTAPATGTTGTTGGTTDGSSSTGGVRPTIIFAD